MKKLILAAAATFLVATAVSYAAPVRDWHDLDRVHTNIVRAINDMQRARIANHYDMEGHGAKAEQLLREAEGELHASVEAIKAAH